MYACVSSQQQFKTRTAPAASRSARAAGAATRACDHATLASSVGARACVIGRSRTSVNEHKSKSSHEEVI